MILMPIVYVKDVDASLAFYDLGFEVSAKLDVERLRTGVGAALALRGGVDGNAGSIELALNADDLGPLADRDDVARGSRTRRSATRSSCAARTASRSRSNARVTSKRGRDRDRRPAQALQGGPSLDGVTFQRAPEAGVPGAARGRTARVSRRRRAGARGAGQARLGTRGRRWAWVTSEPRTVRQSIGTSPRSRVDREATGHENLTLHGQSGDARADLDARRRAAPPSRSADAEDRVVAVTRAG